jgi:TolB-like protein/Tfp pilus assembly protein PilF
MALRDSDEVGALLEQALGLPTDARAAFLNEACDGDKELREELASLLVAHDAGSGYFERLTEQIVGPALVTLTHDPRDEFSIGQTIAQYRLIEPLGSGGMGVVFKALDLRLDRFVALKFLSAPLSTDSGAKERLMAEAKATSALDHPNIGVVHDIGETSAGRLFIVMAYYEGETLERKSQRGAVSVHEAVDLAEQMASALAAAHLKGIVHRDVKPSNILVTPEGTAKLLDFGIAKLADSKSTQDGVARGTVAYMSPEQTRGTNIDHRTDFWSLGVVLYELLTGVRPFRADHDEAIIYAIRHDTYGAVERVNPAVPRALARIVGRCLAKDPADRYGHATEVLSDLSALAGGESPSAGGRLNRGGLGRPLWYVAAAVLLAVLVAGALHFRPASEKQAAPPVERVGALRNRVAVLPLAAVGSDPDERYVAEGMTSDLIARLSSLRGLRVIARSSVMRYRGTGKTAMAVGQELRAGAVLQGSVQKAADQIQIALRLVDAKSNDLLWSEHYAEEIGDLQAVQHEIAQRVVEVLRVQLEPTERRQLTMAGTSNPDAYMLYLKGRHFLDKWDEASAGQARGYFQRALDLDPAFAQAWTGLGDAYHVLSALETLPEADAYPRTKAAAERALQIDPHLPEAHVSLATALSAFYWDFEGAAQHIRRAIELNPSDATAHVLYGEYLRYRGRFAEALVETRQAEELDPLAPAHQLDTGIVLYLARRYDEAIAQYRRLLSMNPDHRYAYFALALAYVQAKQYEEAVEALDRAGAAGRLRVQQHTLRGYIHGRTGRRPEARKELDRLKLLSREQHVSPWHFAIVHLGLGEHDRTLDLLEEAYRHRAWQLRLLRVEPMFDSLQSNARFRALADKVK